MRHRRRAAPLRGRELRPRARPRRPSPHPRPRPRRGRVPARPAGPAARSSSAASPRPTATRSPPCPKRAAIAAAPLWRRAVGAGKRGDGDGSDPDYGHALEAEVDVHAFEPAAIRAIFAEARLRGRPDPRRGAARQPLRLVAAHGRVDRRAGRDPRPLAATSPSAATWPCRRSTPRCSSRTCRPSSSTTSSSPRASQRPRAEATRGLGISAERSRPPAVYRRRSVQHLDATCRSTSRMLVGRRLPRTRRSARVGIGCEGGTRRSAENG